MASKALLARVDSLEGMVAQASGNHDTTIFGLYRPAVGDEVGAQLVKVVSKRSGEWQELHGVNPQITLPIKLEPVMTRPKRFIIVIGGRGSGKSHSIADINLSEMHDYGSRVAFLREFQNSLDDSSYSLLVGEIERLELQGFRVLDTRIESSTGGLARFRGLARNTQSIKGLAKFNIFATDEAQTISADSLRALTPTMRDDSDPNGGRMIFSANPGSSEDAFSQRFIVPFYDELLRKGIYEDDLHLVIMMNYTDNPWFNAGMKAELEYDKQTLSRALFDHIWLGAFNDSVDDSIILTEWFDACIDAHKVLGWKPTGMRIAAFDPADSGNDSKAYVQRHGSVITKAVDWFDGDANDATDIAVEHAQKFGADAFLWDVAGLGAGLRRQVTDSFSKTKVIVEAFSGAGEVEGKEEPFQSMSWREEKVEGDNIRTNGDVFMNRRAQAYFRVRERMFNTYRAVVKKEYVDPDDMLSLDSEGIGESMTKLRAELCRIPRKRGGNGKFQIMSKDEMKSKLKLKSPGMADCVSMLMMEPQPAWVDDYSDYTVPCGVG